MSSRGENSIIQQDQHIYDVIICGGGLAGLCLARQLRLEDDKLSILVLDQLKRPLPDAAFKVGESTIEAGAYYFGELLKLRGYLEEEHLPKLGVRYFYGDSQQPFARRPEFGVRDWLPAPSYQLDRGKLESHLRQLVIDAGVELLEGATTQDIILNEEHGTHEVMFYPSNSAQPESRRCHWVIDAMGRRRFLQQKLQLTKKFKQSHSSAWFRVNGQLSVDQFVAPDDQEWHGRVVPDRWFSTNHLMGKGYWVWLIPLAPNNTSIGIVTSEEYCPSSEYNTFDKAVDWLENHEPEIAKRIRSHELLDFKVLKNYSYSSHQVFSENRWACVGEAGAFIDPYYAIGSNMIAFANGYATRMIQLERSGQLDSEFVDHANRFYLSLIDNLTHNIQLAYPFFDHPQVTVLKTIWDYYVGWGIADPQLYHEVYLDPKVSSVVSNMVSRAVISQLRMMDLFTSWARKSPDDFGFEFDFVDYIEDLPTLTSLFERNLHKPNKPIHETLADFRHSMDRIEEIANVIFFLAVEDVLPDHSHRFHQRWINPCAISLDPDRWDDDGLFESRGPARNIAALEQELRRLCRFREGADREQVTSG